MVTFREMSVQQIAEDTELSTEEKIEKLLEMELKPAACSARPRKAR